ncbi:MAG: putative rane protein [Blastococcus sp.]|nr:putative rane protein [Blastococcus sp.]
MEDVGLDSAIQDCRKRSVDAAGTAHVLEDRAARLGRQLKLLNFVGLAVPVIVGGLVLGYGAGMKALGLVIAVGAGLTVLQLVVAVWSMTAGWVDAQAASTRSAIRNRELARSFDRMVDELAAESPRAVDEYNRLAGRDDSQQDNDYALGFSEPETRAAHRAGLRMYRVTCVGCETVPKDMKATDCGVCGDFVRSSIRGYRAGGRSDSRRNVSVRASARSDHLDAG